MASFKKSENGTWQVSFYCKDFLGNNKKYKKSGFKTKALANQYANNYIALHTGSVDVLFNDIVNEFIEEKNKKIKTNTKKSYYYFQNIVNENFKNIKLKDINQKIILKFLNRFEDKPAIRKKYLNYFKLIFEYANIFFNYNLDIMKKIKIDTKYEKKTKQIWTVEEFNAFDDILKMEKIKHLRPYYNLLYYSGARAGEISALFLEDIDFKNNTISINKTRLLKQEYNTPKTKSSIRTITIPNKIMEILKDYVETIPKIQKTFIFNFYTYYKIFLYAIIMKHNFKKITLHSFRHSHASLLIKKGVPITDISKRLGHSNSNVTLSTYSHFYQENKKEDIALNVLNNL